MASRASRDGVMRHLDTAREVPGVGFTPWVRAKSFPRCASEEGEGLPHYTAGDRPEATATRGHFAVCARQACGRDESPPYYGAGVRAGACPPPSLRSRHRDGWARGRRAWFIQMN